MATKLKNLRISKVDFVDEGANPDAHIKLTKSKGEKGQSTGENGDKNGFVSRLFGFIGKKAGMNQEEIDSAVSTVCLEMRRNMRQPTHLLSTSRCLRS